MSADYLRCLIEHGIADRIRQRHQEILFRDLEVVLRSECLSGNISERKSAFSGCEQCLVPEGDLSRWSLRRLKSHNDFNGMFPDRHLGAARVRAPWLG